MSTPITVKHRVDDAEALQFDGTAQSAWTIGKWLQEATKGTDAEYGLALSFRETLHGPSEMSFSTGGDSYSLDFGDWVIKEGDLFSVCRRQDFPYRFVSPIEKIKIEAGLS